MSTNAQIHEVGVFIGGSNFIGDVGPTTYVSPNEPAFGLLYNNPAPTNKYVLKSTFFLEPLKPGRPETLEDL